MFNRARLQTLWESGSWLVLERVYRIVVGVLLNAWFARHFGVDGFGVLSVAIAIHGIASAVFSLGLEGVVVREVAFDGKDQSLLANALFMRLCAGFLIFVLILFWFFTDTESGSPLILIVLVLSLGFPWQALEVIDYGFRGRNIFGVGVKARCLGFSVGVAIKIIMMFSGASLLDIACATVLEVFVAGVALLYAMRGSGFQWEISTLSLKIIRPLLRNSLPLLCSQLLILAYIRTDQLLISAIDGMGAAGMYAAAVRAVEVLYVLPTLFAVTITPVLAEAFKRAEKEFAVAVAWLTKMVFFLGVISATAFSLVGELLVEILFGSEFSAAGSILRIYVWGVPLVFVGIIHGQWALVKAENSYTVWRNFLGLSVNVLANIFLIPTYGVNGAAVSHVIGLAIANVIAPLCMSEYRLTIGVHLLRRTFFKKFSLLSRNRD